MLKVSPSHNRKITYKAVISVPGSIFLVLSHSVEVPAEEVSSWKIFATISNYNIL